MARLLARIVAPLVATVALGSSACSDDSPSAPSRQPSTPPERPAPSLPPLAEGRYRLLVTAAGPSMGCEVATPGVGLGGVLPLVAGSFSEDVALRQVAAGWSIGPDAGADRTLALIVNGATWPESPVVTGILSGRSDQRAYDGPAIDAGARDRPAAFSGAVLTGASGSGGTVMTGTVNGRLTFSEAWTGQVTVCRSAQLLLQRP